MICRAHIATTVRPREPVLCEQALAPGAATCPACGSPVLDGATIARRMLAFFEAHTRGADVERVLSVTERHEANRARRLRKLARA